MPRIEKTVFISYRRKDISWALNVYHYLTSHGYDVFFDYKSIPSGDFEQIIIGNIKARVHFLIILTPTALDRCKNSGDWLRREIETAIDEKRNIVPLFFDQFSFASRSISKRLTGKLAMLKRYNGLEVHAGFFDEAIERLCEQLLNVELDAVIHPVSAEARQAVKEQQSAANQALEQGRETVNKIRTVQKKSLPAYAVAVIALLILIMMGFGGYSAIKNWRATGNPTPTESPPSFTFTPEPPTPTPTETPIPPSPTATPLGSGSTQTSQEDGMVMVYVPEGEFTMGADADDALAECQTYRSNCQRSWFVDEEPPHTVYVDAFWIDRTEVNNAMFAAFLNAQGNQSKEGYNWLDAGDKDVLIHMTGDTWQADAGYKNHPAIELTWFGAHAYCTWAERRLPTEAEWEKAASWHPNSNEKLIFPWGNIFDCEKGNFDDETLIDSYVGPGGVNCDGYPKNSPVGNFPAGASPYGVLDMAGSVWEWAVDWYDAYPGGNSNASPDFGQTHKTLRGGSWNIIDYSLNTTLRYGDLPTDSLGSIGFRCAQSP